MFVQQHPTRYQFIQHNLPQHYQLQPQHQQHDNSQHQHQQLANQLDQHQPQPQLQPQQQQHRRAMSADEYTGVMDLSSRDPQQVQLEDLLTKEQNTCIEIRDICTNVSSVTKDVLHTGFKPGFVYDLKRQFILLQRRIEVLEMLTTQKTAFSDEFVAKTSTEWLAKRLSSASRQRRLRGHKRKADSVSEIKKEKTPRTATGERERALSFGSVYTALTASTMMMNLKLPTAPESAPTTPNSSPRKVFTPPQTPSPRGSPMMIFNDIAQQQQQQNPQPQHQYQPPIPALLAPTSNSIPMPTSTSTSTNNTNFALPLPPHNNLQTHSAPSSPSKLSPRAMSIGALIN